jgi:hypothetical protein
MGATTAAVLAAATLTLAGTQPQLAARGDEVYVVVGRGESVVVARSDDGGRSFGEPVALPFTGRLSLGQRRGPRIAVSDEAVVVAAVTGAVGGGKDGDVVVTRSTDRGRTWSPPMVINDVPAAAREGLHALAAGADGRVVAAWLDLRAGGTRVYSAVSSDAGATWQPDTLVHASSSGAVCECCHPSIAIGTGGEVAVMFRNSVGGNRDMYVARSDDGGRFGAAVKLGRGTWELNACPMDGGGLVVGPRGELTAVWRREGTVFLTTGDGPEERIGDGRDAVVGVAGDDRDIAWSADAGVTLVRESGVSRVLGPGRFPSLLSFADRTIVAWEDQGRTMVEVVER